MPENPRPLTTFLIALSHSSPLLQQFHAGELVPGDFGLTDEQMALLRDGNLMQIQEAVQAENPHAVYAGFWIDVDDIPDWWIFGAEGSSY